MLFTTAIGASLRRTLLKIGGQEAEEVGFEPTVPRRGTPVFETGPFNHSGTPPRVARLGDGLGWTALFEEVGKDFAAFGLKDAGGEGGAVVQAGVGGDAVEGIAGSGFGVGGSVDDAGDSALDDGAGTHRARFQSHVEDAAVEAPGAKGTTRES